LRAAHAHRRLGFAAGEVAGFMAAAGLDLIAKDDLAPGAGEANKLTVSLWLGRDRRLIADPLPLTAREVA
jgi:demethylmenaquinone methyltransferase/2-methoxy-6-polyprenyl-1,4-benzoquinol methylase/ArsR family transcriptional regulator